MKTKLLAYLASLLWPTPTPAVRPVGQVLCCKQIWAASWVSGWAQCPQTGEWVATQTLLPPSVCGCGHNWPNMPRIHVMHLIAHHN